MSWRPGRRSDWPWRNGTGLLVSPADGWRRRFSEWWEASPLGGRAGGAGTAHFNALRGRDGWKAVPVARDRRPDDAGGEDAARPGGGDRRASRRSARIRRGGTRSGRTPKDPEREWVREKTVPGREDALEQALLDTIAPTSWPRRSDGCGWCGGRWRGWRSTS